MLFLYAEGFQIKMKLASEGLHRHRNRIICQAICFVDNVTKRIKFIHFDVHWTITKNFKGIGQCLLRPLVAVEYQNLFCECVVIFKIIGSLFRCGQVCHNCACAFSRSVKNQLFQKDVIYISLDAELKTES